MGGRLDLVGHLEGDSLWSFQLNASLSSRIEHYIYYLNLILNLMLMM